MTNELDKSILKICIVDDSNKSRQAIAEILENAGYNITGSFSDPVQSYRESKSSGSNLYIIDVVMPEMSGIELAKKITDNSMNVSIIMMSSLHTENIIIDSISSGASDFIQKPFEAKDLLQSVEKILIEKSR